MLQDSYAFSGFSTNNLDETWRFYQDVLGLNVNEIAPMGLLELNFSSGAKVIIYPKDDHQAATFTVLNFPVSDLDKTVDELTAKGVVFERYPGFKQDEKGIARTENPEYGPDIAWFKDPGGNIIAVMAEV